MAEHGVSTACQHCGHPDSLTREATVPNRVNATMDDVQAPRRDAVLDRPPPEAKREQLPPGDQTMLAAGKVGDRPIS